MGEAKRKAQAQWLPVAESPQRKPGWWQVKPDRSLEQYIIDVARCFEERALRCTQLANRKHCTYEAAEGWRRRAQQAKHDLRLCQQSAKKLLEEQNETQ